MSLVRQARRGASDRSLMTFASWFRSHNLCWSLTLYESNTPLNRRDIIPPTGLRYISYLPYIQVRLCCVHSHTYMTGRFEETLIIILCGRYIFPCSALQELHTRFFAHSNYCPAHSTTYSIDS